MTPVGRRLINDTTIRGLSEDAKKSYLSADTGLARHHGRGRSPAGVCFGAEATASREALEGPIGKEVRSDRRRQFNPIPLHCVDVGSGITAEDPHSLPPWKPAQFSLNYFAQKVCHTI